MRISAVQELVQQFRNAGELTLEEVEAFHERARACEKELSFSLQARGSPYLRIFSRMQQFGEYLAVKKLKKELLAIQTTKAKEQEDRMVDRMIWHCQRKGFISSEGKQEMFQLFQNHLPSLELLGVENLFSIRIVSKETGTLELVVVSKTEAIAHEIKLRSPLGAYSLGTTKYQTVDALVAEYASKAIPITQLQDVKLWLDMHGSAVYPLTSRIVEEKLQALMKACPTGAYVLYPTTKNGLCLSRLLKHGAIHHFAIDLQKKPGCFTFDIGGKSFSATTLEFKRKLEMMGTPLKVLKCL